MTVLRYSALQKPGLRCSQRSSSPQRAQRHVGEGRGHAARRGREPGVVAQTVIAGLVVQRLELGDERGKGARRGPHEEARGDLGADQITLSHVAMLRELDRAIADRRRVLPLAEDAHRDRQHRHRVADAWVVPLALQTREEPDEKEVERGMVGIGGAAGLGEDVDACAHALVGDVCGVAQLLAAAPAERQHAAHE